MRKLVLISLAASFLPLSAAQAVTMGEVGRTAVAFVSTECSPAYERHQTGWPEAGAPRDVVWRNEAFLTSEQEIVSANPALLDHLPRLTAWQMSGYSLVDDLALAGVLIIQDGELPQTWLDSYAGVANSLGASVDIYSCARLSDAAFGDAVADGAGAGLLDTVATFDCLAAIGRQMNDVFDANGDAGQVHAALTPLIAEIDACGGES